MEQTEFQQQVQRKLEKEFTTANVTFLGYYKGQQLAFAIDEKPADDDDDSIALTGYYNYVLVDPGDFEHYHLITDTDFEITDYFFPPEQSKDSSDIDEELPLH